MRWNSNILICLLVAALAGCITPSRPQHEGDSTQLRDVPSMARSGNELRKRIIVLPFLDLTPAHATMNGGPAAKEQAAVLDSRVADSSRKMLIQQLGSLDTVMIVDIKDVPGELAKFIKNDAFDLNEIAKLASGLGVSAVIEGRIVDAKTKRLGDQVGVFRQVKSDHVTSVRMRMMSAKTGRSLLDESRTAHVESTQTLVGSRPEDTNRDLPADPQLAQESSDKAFRSLLKPIVAALDKMSWEGRIALVTAEKIYLNSGRMTGLQVGDILRVRETGENVFDPKSGDLLGTAPGRVKGTLEVVAYFGKDGAVAVVHSGSGFQENDLVELY